MRLFFVVLAVIASSASGNGQTIPIDDFEDGNDEGWTRHDLSIGESWGPGTSDASSKSYRLEGSGPVDVDGLGTLFSTWNGSSPPQFSNGYLKAKVTANSSSLPFIFMRGNVPPDEDWSYYLLGARPDLGNFVVHRAEDDVDIFERFSAEWQYRRDDDWFFELGVVGNEISAKVWPVNEQEPAGPQWTYTDPAPLPGGLVGVGSWLPVGIPSDTVSATFDDVIFTVPEPSAALLCLAGLLNVIASLRGRDR